LTIFVIFKRVRTSENLPLLLLASFAGTFISMWHKYYEGIQSSFPLTVSCFGSLLLMIYIFWYSRYGRHENIRLSVGSKFPDIEFTDLEGNLFQSSSSYGRSSIFIFYCGNWSSSCLAQIDELYKRSQELNDLNIVVNLISSQSIELTKDLALKYSIPFNFFVDHNGTIAEYLEIALKNGVPFGLVKKYGSDSLMPTLIVTNSQNTIVFTDQTNNYRVRPEPDVYLSILRRARR
tara:strand:+ start:6732 stop:7433 length:702 start_codon:yes stop_codon:yes gene_type:complete